MKIKSILFALDIMKEKTGCSSNSLLFSSKARAIIFQNIKEKLLFKIFWKTSNFFAF